jgi:hypothetical protein
MTETRTRFDTPELHRLRYFHGQLLGAGDFQGEQEYLRDKLKLHVRCLLGYGVVCGLHVEGEAGDYADAAPDTESTAGHDRPRRARVRITSGLAIDVDGNDVVVRDSCDVNLWEALPPDERHTDEPPRRVWVGVAYHERAVRPTRTVFTSDCGDTSDCQFGWTREAFRIVVTAQPPEPDPRCDTCCDPCCDGHDNGCAHTVVWLARIDDIDWYRPVRPEEIQMRIRRLFGRRVPTVITGINWIHGHTYTVREAQEILGTYNPNGGLRLRFSHEIRTDSLQRGVVDIQVIEGGAGRNASSWFMGGRFEGVPDDEYTRELRYRQTTREVLQDDDRVLITVRTAFLLDRCCRPVDGTHVGGRVPLLDHRPDETDRSGCVVPWWGYPPWTSGSGAGGDAFESWFFVREDQ